MTSNKTLSSHESFYHWDGYINIIKGFASLLHLWPVTKAFASPTELMRSEETQVGDLSLLLPATYNEKLILRERAEYPKLF